MTATNRQETRRLAVSEWVTLDGVFDADTMGQWFQPFESKERGAYIQRNVQTADAVLVGRVTYEMLASYWPTKKNNEDGIADRLNKMPKYVVSSRLKTAEWNNSTIIKSDVVGEIGKLKRQPGQDILVFGSAALVQSLMKADLVDEYRFLVHPIIVGSGKRFFKDGMNTKGLKLVRTETLPKDVILQCYAPAPGGPA